MRRGFILSLLLFAGCAGIPNEHFYGSCLMDWKPGGNIAFMPNDLCYAFNDALDRSHPDVNACTKACADVAGQQAAVNAVTGALDFVFQMELRCKRECGLRYAAR